MFKQLTFVFLLILVASAKRHSKGDDGMKCAKDQCPAQLSACNADSKCKPTIRSCMAANPEQDQTEEQIDQFEACIKANQAAYDFMDCIMSKCSPQRLSKHQLKTFNKMMKSMH